MTDGNDPAFPVPVGTNILDYGGLTKREWLAGMAMQGILAHCEHDRVFSDIVLCSMTIADELLVALHKTEKSGE